MTITVRYFASLREALGTDERIAHHAGATLGSIRDALIASDAAHAGAGARAGDPLRAEPADPAGGHAGEGRVGGRVLSAGDGWVIRAQRDALAWIRAATASPCVNASSNTE